MYYVFLLYENLYESSRVELTPSPFPVSLFSTHYFLDLYMQLLQKDFKVDDSFQCEDWRAEYNRRYFFSIACLSTEK